MNIEFNQVSKRYRYEWILKNFSYKFESNKSYSIIGQNGSGKSTLVQLISCYLSPSKGNIKYYDENILVDNNNVYKHISFSSPYIDLTEELTLEETVKFHFSFKPLLQSISHKSFFEIIGLPKSALNKQVRFFSSGMKQRLKLGLSFLSDTPVLLLDEPTITLDREGVAWYKLLLEKYALNKRLVIIASNVEEDIEFCNENIKMSDLK
jgi:ABC-type multidrug transport system ATPase subunit